MPTDRLFKFSIPGLMFFLSFLFFYFLFDGDVNEILESINKYDFTGVIGLLISTPIVGVIVSTFGVAVWQCFQGYQVWYYPPTSRIIIDDVLREQQDLRNEIIADGWIITKATRRRFYWFYQTRVREHLEGEQISFLDRRWSASWTHFNNISAILSSFLIVLVLRLIKWKFSSLDCDCITYKILGLVIIFFYGGCAWFYIRTSRRDASEVEHSMLEDAINAKKIKALIFKSKK